MPLLSAKAGQSAEMGRVSCSRGKEMEVEWVASGSEPCSWAQKTYAVAVMACKQHSLDNEVSDTQHHHSLNTTVMQTKLLMDMKHQHSLNIRAKPNCWWPVQSNIPLRCEQSGMKHLMIVLHSAGLLQEA